MEGSIVVNREFELRIFRGSFALQLQISTEVIARITAEEVPDVIEVGEWQPASKSKKIVVPKKGFIVDYSTVARIGMVRIFIELGLDYMEAADGAAALDALRKNTDIHIVFCDYNNASNEWSFLSQRDQ